MAEAVQEKSRGMKFAEQQLLRHGWIQGKGLGREENGISEAIKVKVKCDKEGFGHKKGEEFTFHWWDHVFNQASANLQNDVKMKKTVAESQAGMISNKKPRKATLSKDKMYGCFVKSATLLSGQEQPEPKSSMLEDSSSSDDDDQRLDLSSTTKLSNADLVKACGGRTAHKGARHGLTMSAKLARLEQQEAEFMAKYGKKSQSANASSEGSARAGQSAASISESQDRTTDVSRSKKLKKKKSCKEADEDVKELKGEVSPESCGMDSKLKKKERKGARSEEGGDETVVPPEEESGPVEHVKYKAAGRKRKQGKKNRKENGEAADVEAPAEKKNTGDTGEISSEQWIEPTSKKKKRSSKECREPADTEQHDTEFEEFLPKSKNKGGEESTRKQKRKKCKDNRKALDSVNEDVASPKKKKKKKKSKE